MLNTTSYYLCLPPPLYPPEWDELEYELPPPLYPPLLLEPPKLDDELLE